VDVVLEDPYSLPFETASTDVVISSSCFEHSEMFWVLFIEIMRILKPHGLFYLNAPSNGDFHRYPVDCWRFYPDSGRALVTWAKRNEMNPALLESYASAQSAGDQWNDFVAVFVRDEAQAQRHHNRILDGKKDVFNGVMLGSEGFVNPRPMPEDRMKLAAIKQIIDNRVKVM
jgi:SAM-dependent methyltransferase